MGNKNLTYEKLGIFGFISAGILGTFLVILSLPGSNRLPTLLTETLNILVLFAFYSLIRPKKFNPKDDSEIAVLAESLNIVDRDFKTAKINIDRVNKVITQLCGKIFGFIIFLLLFYTLNFLEDWKPEYFSEHLNSPFPIIDFLENVFNAISAAFIYFGFKVLYDSTLDENNNPKNYYKGTLIFLLGFILSYFLLLLINTDNPHSQDKDKISYVYNLGCGIYNGWAMGLLFGRLISMEYFFKEIQLTTSKFSRRFFHYGAIFILPIYVLANCLYGVQKFEEFNYQNMQALKALIFLICFFGKGFFLLFIYHYINFKWLHIYLHLILANNSIPRDIIKVFAEFGTTGPQKGIKKNTFIEKEVFIVHGHNDAIKNEVEMVINKLGLRSIILNVEANSGMTIIEKFEHHSNVGFAVIIFSDDDEAKSKNDVEIKTRARQNVILELGYFIAKIGRKNICALYVEGVELPSDLLGLGYTKIDASNTWKLKLAKELDVAGYKIEYKNVI